MEKESIDPFKQLEFDFTEKFYSVQIKYYIGLHYANENQYEEAYLILHNVQADIEEALEYARKNKLKGGKVETTIKELEQDMI